MSRSVGIELASASSEEQSTSNDFVVDANVVAAFPAGSRIKSAIQLAKSTWTTTARLRVEFPEGFEREYFLKSASDDAGRNLAKGEFHAMSEIFNVVSDMVPRPLSWGKYATGYPETYYTLSEFIDMNDCLPDPDRLCEQLARLHNESRSPTGQFGFHTVTCQGKTPQAVSWEDSWTAFFLKLLRHVVRLDFEVNGYWEMLDILERRVMAQVIPNLIGALERDGRRVKPCLIHADLWEGNTGTSRRTGDVLIFDAAAFYAHNEMETGNWRCHYNKIHRRVYRDTYLRYVRPSEPAGQWDDRNRMYSIYFNIIFSVNHGSAGEAVRQAAYDDMYFLVDKYAPFSKTEGPRRLMEGERVLLSAERDHNIS
ncbi:Fructosamine kinase-domain-containing protein [Phyllosticta citricarpa]|uniref:protein-ribulosamine 3-kinase n=2 Tax=Phyllosticta TaxID=121621 RepID=A0ABR1LIH4_9PEZI